MRIFLAIVASSMALSGIESIVSASEVVRAMEGIGNNMSKIYKETAMGGLAMTITGRDVTKRRGFGC